MRCPVCETNMLDGNYLIEGTAFRFFLIGWSWQSLWFKPNNPKPKQKRKLLIQDRGSERPGKLCPSCGTVVMPRPHRSRSISRLPKS